MRTLTDMNSPLADKSLFLVGHGSSKDQKAEQSLHMHAEKIAKTGLFKRIYVDFLKKENEELQFGEEPLFVVPFFMSDGYFVQEKVPERVNQKINQSQLSPSEVFYGPPLGSDPEIGDVIQSMIEEFCMENKVLINECLPVLLAHGSPRSEAAQQTCLEAAENIRRKHQLDIRPVFLETEPVFSSIRLERKKKPSNDLKHIIVVGMFAAEGPHVTEDIPQLIEEAKSEYEDEGIRVSYAGTLGLRPEITRLIEKCVFSRTDC
ncbi:MAG: hypothetical protein MI743_06675 [Sneathiellales bacterium]|nr:hypothetical protein [Sneathiellales bacterium]